MEVLSYSIRVIVLSIGHLNIEKPTCMNLNLIIIQIVCVLIFLCANMQSQTVTDYDGNIYRTIKIGNQTWMTENLRTTHYYDGTSIGDGSLFDHYTEEIAYCIGPTDTTKYFFYYNNNKTYEKPYGCLYNWYAAVNGTNFSDSHPGGIQGVCPSGWHVPSRNEYEELQEFVGDNSFSRLLTGGESGFNAVYGGYRNDVENSFFGLGSSGSYISTTLIENNPCFISLFEFHKSENQIIFRGHTKTTGYSVRCIKDSGATRMHAITTNMAIFYPNPCKDIVYINSNGGQFNYIRLYSLDGQEIKLTGFKEVHYLDLSHIEKGIYIIKTEIDNFICVYTLVKE